MKLSVDSSFSAGTGKLWFRMVPESKISKQDDCDGSRSRARLQRDYARSTPTVPVCRRRNLRLSLPVRVIVVVLLLAARRR